MSKQKTKKNKRVNKRRNKQKPTKSSKRFLILFVGLLFLFYFLFSTTFFKDYFFTPINHTFAVMASWVLLLFGETTTVFQTVIRSPEYAVNIAKGCDSVEAIALLGIGLAVFPIQWQRKLKGMIIGAALFLGLNLIRIVSLFLIGKYVPSIFDFMHVDVWQALFLFLIVSFWLWWVIHSIQQQNQSTHAPS